MSFRASKWPWKFGTQKTVENYQDVEPFWISGIGGWPPTSTWINKHVYFCYYNTKIYLESLFQWNTSLPIFQNSTRSGNMTLLLKKHHPSSFGTLSQTTSKTYYWFFSNIISSMGMFFVFRRKKKWWWSWWGPMPWKTRLAMRVEPMPIHKK